MAGWMTCDFTSFQQFSVISGRWARDNERLCALEPRLPLKRSTPQARLEPVAAESVGQRLTYEVTRAPAHKNSQYTRSCSLRI